MDPQYGAAVLMGLGLVLVLVITIVLVVKLVPRRRRWAVAIAYLNGAAIIWSQS